MAGTARWVGVIHGRAVGDAAPEVLCACSSTAARRPWVEVRRGLLSCRARVAAGAARWGLRLGRSALQADCTAMLAPGSCRRTHCAPCGRSVQTTAASQFTKRVGARRPRHCASRRPRHRPQRAAPAATTTTGGLRVEHHCGSAKAACPGSPLPHRYRRREELRKSFFSGIRTGLSSRAALKGTPSVRQSPSSGGADCAPGVVDASCAREVTGLLSESGVAGGDGVRPFTGPGMGAEISIEVVVDGSELRYAALSARTAPATPPPRSHRRRAACSRGPRCPASACGRRRRSSWRRGATRRTSRPRRAACGGAS